MKKKFCICVVTIVDSKIGRKLKMSGKCGLMGCKISIRDKYNEMFEEKYEFLSYDFWK